MFVVCCLWLNFKKQKTKNKKQKTNYKQIIACSLTGVGFFNNGWIDIIQEKIELKTNYNWYKMSFRRG
jgi:nitric oxide reductase large subunit